MIREDSVLVPSDARRLWIGVAIGVVGPLAITPIVRTEAMSGFPGVPYVLVIVAATVFGRLLAAAIGTLVSVVLLDWFFVEAPTGIAIRTLRDLLAIVTFIVVAFVVAQLLARFERAARAEERERYRLAFLAEVGDILSGSLDVDTAMKQLGEVLVPAVADWFSVVLLDDGALRSVAVVHPDAEKLTVARELQERFPNDPDAPRGAPNVIRTGRAELIESISDEMLDALAEEPELREAIRGLGLRCAMTVPLTARGRTFGALTLVGAESHERYGPADLRLAEEVADRAALAIDTARLFAAETEARARATAEARRNEVLMEATAAFGRATTVEEAMSAMLDGGIRLAGATAGTVGIVAEDRRVRLIGISGYTLDDHRYWHEFGLDERLPMAEAILERRPVILTTTEERDRRYPSLVGRGEQEDHVLACLPLLLGDRAIGGFSASYAPGTEFGEEDLTFLRTLGEQAAQAIDRVRSIESERVTRARFDALASASRGLATTLDFDATATTVVRLANEHLGRRATLYAIEAHGPTELAVADERGPRMAAQAARATPPPELGAAIEEALDERRTRLLEPAGEGANPDAVLPLLIAESMFGALVVTEPVRDLRRADELAFANELARRMARAMENARLYRDRDYVARTLQTSLLPPELPEVPGVQVDALFQPAFRGLEVGGDFYDVFQTPTGTWAAVVGDVCGKGVEAATLTGLVRHTLRAVSDAGPPSEILAELNRALLRERLDGRFCTVVYLTIGGHPLPQRITASGEVERVGRHGTLLGVVPEPALHDVEVRLAPGDALVAFTDGILRKQESEGDEPGRLLDALRGSSPGSAAEIRERIERYVGDLPAEDQGDDIAVLVVRAR
jgi:GAF domain-containing protein